VSFNGTGGTTYRILVGGFGGASGNVSIAATVVPPQIQCTVQTSPLGRSFTVDGTAYTTSQTFSWVSGSSHAIATTSPQSGGTGIQSVWSSWSDGGAMSHIVAPTSGTTYTANFPTQYYLTMSAGTGGTVNPSSGWYDSGVGVSISATPNSGYSLSGWTGNGSGSYSGVNNPASVTMNAPITETGNFITTAIPGLGTMRQGNNFVLSWPTNDPAFKLEYATNLLSTNLAATIWISNQVVPSIVNGRYIVTNAITGDKKFYRLKK
jgi:hypothetical protein